MDSDMFFESMQEDEKIFQQAHLDPAFDYFEYLRTSTPKKAIGEYVLEQGFNVPVLANDELSTAVDDGNAFFRSELMQDYDGYGGLFASKQVEQMIIARNKSDFTKRFEQFVREGLKTGDITPDTFMERFIDHGGWLDERSRLYAEIVEAGIEDIALELYPRASSWRYIPGTNVTMFRDPHVDGRYHFGVKPHEQGIGNYQFEAGEHSDEKQFRKHRQPFVAAPFIDMYEEIRGLPLFDTSQVPVMEIQQGESGELHFLQYRKVHKKLDVIDPFDLRTTADGFYTDNVRGVTTQEGVPYKLEISPRTVADMTTQGVFTDMLYMSAHQNLKLQAVCNKASFVLCESLISFKDNHTSSSPLYMPDIAAGVFGATSESLDRFRWFTELMFEPRVEDYRRGGRSCFFDVHLISNGQQALIESDWKIKPLNDFRSSVSPLEDVETY